MLYFESQQKKVMCMDAITFASTIALFTLVIIAVVEDVRFMRIRNRLILIGLVLGRFPHSRGGKSGSYFIRHRRNLSGNSFISVISCPDFGGRRYQAIFHDWRFRIARTINRVCRMLFFGRGNSCFHTTFCTGVCSSKLDRRYPVHGTGGIWSTGRI